MAKTHAVGIDLGTTYSCMSYLNEHGEPVTIANREGELSTPSVVLFDGDNIVVGTEALRNAIAHPEIVVQNSKRYMGDANHNWTIHGKTYTPVDMAGFILKKMLDDAREQIGDFETAVITVPAQFSDSQRSATIKAGRQAGLTHVDIINEPVAAALCYVLGTEGMWFTELADEQRILVYDLGGGTFDLSLVRYEKNKVSVIASTGDLRLGGIDWNEALLTSIAQTFVKNFKADPRKNAESLQFLALEVENAKRALTVRQQAVVTCQHENHRKTYQVTQAKFEELTSPLVERTAQITRDLLKSKNMGWAHVDVILTTGGSSRMPMIRKMLKELGGRTLNTSLSPDQSIAHGATYYAGMLLTNEVQARSILSKDATERLSRMRQQSVNARALGILVRDPETGHRIPHELIPANSPLPASATQSFGTVIKNQKRVRLRVIESGVSEDVQFVELGTCCIDDLPPDLPVDSEIAVTLTYDEEARVHVAAESLGTGKSASAMIVREENVKTKITMPSTPAEPAKTADAGVVDEDATIHVPAPSADEASRVESPVASVVANLTPQPEKTSTPDVTPVVDESLTPPVPKAQPVPSARQMASELESAIQPIPLCNACGEPLDISGKCPVCSRVRKPKRKRKRVTLGERTGTARRTRTAATKKQKRPGSRPAPPPTGQADRSMDADITSPFVPGLPNDDDILDLTSDDLTALTGQHRLSAKKTPNKKKPRVKSPPLPPPLQSESQPPSPFGADVQSGEEEFWKLDS